MHTVTRRTLLAALACAPVASRAQGAPRLDRITVAGWSKPITEVKIGRAHV